jgi:hypothetical protein
LMDRTVGVQSRRAELGPEADRPLTTDDPAEPDVTVR